MIGWPGLLWIALMANIPSGTGEKWIEGLSLKICPHRCGEILTRGRSGLQKKIDKGASFQPLIRKYYRKKLFHLLMDEQSGRNYRLRLALLETKAPKKQTKKNRAKGKPAIYYLHRTFMWTALGLMFTTALIGDINALNLFDNRSPPQVLFALHRISAISTSAVYLTGFTLSFFDNSTDNLGKWTKWYPILKWITLAGFISFGALGLLNGRTIPAATPAKTAVTISHAGLAYLTIGSLAMSNIIISFF